MPNHDFVFWGDFAFYVFFGGVKLRNDENKLSRNGNNVVCRIICFEGGEGGEVFPPPKYNSSIRPWFC